MFSVVLASTENHGLGFQNGLPWRIKGDMAFFKNLTTRMNGSGCQNTVIMGRKTWEGIPLKFRPLPDRCNIVLTRQANYTVDGAIVVSSFDEALAAGVKAGGDIFVIGGAELYNAAFDDKRCARIYWTKVRGEDIKCDTFVNALPKGHYILRESNEEAWVTENIYEYKLEIYDRDTK